MDRSWKTCLRSNILPVMPLKIGCMECKPASVLGLGLGFFTLTFILYRLLFLVLGTTSLPSEPELHYAVVMDAGSSGTRAYLYTWPQHTGDPHQLLKISPLLQDGEPMVKKVTPGLSSMGETPDNAFEYLRPLLKFASDNIPIEKHRETPMYILATAGMRLLEKEQQEAVIENVRKGIKENFDFYFPDGHLEIISGKQEGIYQWLAINYVLNKFSHTDHASTSEELVAVEPVPSSRDSGLVFRPRTVGALDMGGASMQIAMEITTNLQLEGMSEKDKSQVAEINLGCLEHDTEHTYRVFVTTYLGFGANEAMRRHERTLFLESSIRLGSIQGLDSENRLKDPCRPLGMKDNKTVTLDLDNLNVDPTVKEKLFETQMVHFYGTGEWETCFDEIKNFTKEADKFTSCSESCPDPGIRPPPIQFENSEFYGFSEYWYSMDDVLGLGGQYMFSKFKQASREFCSGRWHISWNKYLTGAYPKSDVERLETQCFKSVWLTVALHQGLTFPESYGHLSSAPNTVHGQVVHWTLGALLYRTRFFPLRSMKEGGESQHIHHSMYHSNKQFATGYLYSNYIVWLCLAAVSFSIVLYVVRLKRYVKPSSLRNVPSLSKLWSPNDDEEALIGRQDQDYLYAHTKVYVG